MKLTIIRLQQFSEQDRSDLKKIWPQADIMSIEQQLDEKQWVYAARFNDHLLAAASVVLQEQQGQVSRLEVREVTRRRGVGQYLLEEIVAQNPQISNWSVAADGSDDPAVVAAFMRAAGFVQRADNWMKE